MHPVVLELSWGPPSLPLALVILGVGALAAMVCFVARPGRIGAALAAVALLSSVAAAWFGRGQSVRLGPFPVTSYGLCLFGGLAGALLVARRSASRLGVPSDLSDGIVLRAGLSGVLLARLFYVGLNPDGFDSPWSAFAVDSGGLSGLGALLGAALGALWGGRAARLRPSTVADLLAVPAVWMLTLVAAGSYLAGAEHGRLLSGSAPGWLASLGTFPRWDAGLLPGDGPPVLLAQVQREQLPAEAVASLPVHPTQLYELAFCVLLLGVLVSARARSGFRGQQLAMTALAYGAFRLVIEPLRGDADRGLVDVPLPPGLWPALLGLPVVLALVTVAVRQRRSPRRAVAWLGAAGIIVASLVLVTLGTGIEGTSVPQIAGALSVVVAALGIRKRAPLPSG